MSITIRKASSQDAEALFRTQAPEAESCFVRTADIGTLGHYRFVVIFARYRGQWLYCRAKERAVFETAGGHIEPGETPLEAAKRELFEETGAKRYQITPAFDYSVERQSACSSGQVFIAQIHELGEIPDFKMAEVRLFDRLPEALRFPEITPVLFERVEAL